MKTIALLPVLLIACVAMPGCGNKGPLVKPSATPVQTPAAAPDEAQPVAEPAPAATPDPQPVPGTPAAPR